MGRGTLARTENRVSCFLCKGPAVNLIGFVARKVSPLPGEDVQRKRNGWVPASFICKQPTGWILVAVGGLGVGKTMGL